MRYIIIVKATKDSEAGVMPREPLLSAMASYHEELAKAGALIDGSGLQASSKGWRVHYPAGGDGKPTLIDGPFPLTKDLMAGYTIIHANSEDEAREWTLRFPNPAGEGVQTEIEVRRLFELEDFEPGDAIDRFRSLEMGGEG
jgi:hypothetical protein